MPADEKTYVVTPELVYADDTMLLASSPETIQKHLNSIAAVGLTFGLEFNLEKTVQMTIRGDEQIIGTNGQPQEKGAISILGRPAEYRRAVST